MLDPTPVYRGAGLITVSGSLPFVGSVHYIAGASPDTTLVLLSLSLANRALTFSTDGDIPRAAYTVTASVWHGDTAVGVPTRHLEAHEFVRVAALAETTRRDASIVFQKFFTLAPGRYTLTLSLHDDGSSHNGSETLPLVVPRFAAAALSPPVPVYQASARSSRSTLPALIANPRATAYFGRDSLAQMYLEGYDLVPDAQVTVTVRSADRFVLWQDTLVMQGADALRAAVIAIPIARVGIGELTVETARVDGSGMVRTPFFVSVLDDGAIATFDDMLSYLRYFASADQLTRLREAAPRERAAVWTAFWMATDPAPSTPDHEGLQRYFTRLQDANARFDDEGIAGWLTDRGEVFITLGEPDDVTEPRPLALDDQSSIQTWSYERYHLRLVFMNQRQVGARWLLTPSSDVAFRKAADVERAR